MREKIFPIVSGILKRTSHLLIARLPALYMTNLLVCFPLLVFQLAAPELLRSRLNHLPGGALLGAMVLLFLTFFLSVLGTAATHQIIAREHEHAGLWAGLRFIRASFYRLSGTALRYALTVIAGLVLFIPGLIFMVWYALTPQAIAAEDLAGKQAMDRSRELTSGVRYSVFIILMICLTATATISGLTAGLAEFLQVIQSGPPVFSDTARGLPPQFVLNYPGYVLTTMLTFLLNTLVLTFQAVCLTQIYFYVRDGQEIFNPPRKSGRNEVLTAPR